MAKINHRLGSTFYIKKGKAQPALVCLHGGPGGSCETLKVLLKLSKERQIIVYDQLGGGKSSPSSKRIGILKPLSKNST